MYFLAELRQPEGPPSGGNRWIDFLVVIMASGIARGRVRTTTTTVVESRKMAAILQIIGWQRHAALVYIVFLWYMTSCYDQYWHCQIWLSADQYHVTISRAQVYSLSRSPVLLQLTADQVLVFNWIAGSCQVKLLTKELELSRKHVNSNPGLKVNQVITVSSIEILFCESVLWLISNIMLQCYKTQIKIQPYNGSPNRAIGAPLLGWPKSIY